MQLALDARLRLSYRGERPGGVLVGHSRAHRTVWRRRSIKTMRYERDCYHGRRFAGSQESGSATFTVLLLAEPRRRCKPIGETRALAGLGFQCGMIKLLDFPAPFSIYGGSRPSSRPASGGSSDRFSQVCGFGRRTVDVCATYFTVSAKPSAPSQFLPRMPAKDITPGLTLEGSCWEADAAQKILKTRGERTRG